MSFAAFLVAIDVHEFSHALAAAAQGDSTARDQGRLSLNPLRHLDPIGTVLLVIMLFGGIGLGWGKPVPVNPQNLRNGRPGMAIVSLAGVTANLLTAIVCGLLLRAHIVPASQLAVSFVVALIGISLALAVFNLLPIFPLDGFNVAVNVLPAEAGRKLARYAHWGPGILMLLIFLPSLLPAQFFPTAHNLNLLAYLIDPPLRLLEHAILGT